MHKVAGVREVIEAAGARLRYLPNICRISNLIEQAFSKLKAHLRKRRTFPVSRRIGALTAKFSPQECENYFRHAGYASKLAVFPASLLIYLFASLLIVWAQLLSKPYEANPRRRREIS